MRGTLDELADWAADGVLGEITVVLAGADAARRIAALVAEVQDARSPTGPGQGRLRARWPRRIPVPVAA